MVASKRAINFTFKSKESFAFANTIKGTVTRDVFILKSSIPSALFLDHNTPIR